MELTTRQRATLRGMANELPVVLYVGKEGVTDATVKETYDVLQARELIKGAVLKNAPVTAREVSETLCAKLGAQPVQTIGNRFVLFRRNEKKPKIEF